MGVTGGRAGWLLRRAARSLVTLLICLTAVFVVLPVVCGVWLPFLVPVLYCFFGALCYVAFREIYLGVAENSPARAAPVTAAASAVARPSPLSSRT